MDKIAASLIIGVDCKFVTYFCHSNTRRQ